jgi:hypothetical protein
MMVVSTRAHAYQETIPKEEIYLSISLIIEERTFEIPSRCTPLEAPTRPEIIVLPDLRKPDDYATAPCKHECAILEQF